MLAADYPLLNVFLSILYVFLFVIWFWILISVIIDIFRSEDLGGWGKAFWTLFVIALPYLGVFIYLIVRGGGMQERRIADARASQEAMAQYVRETASGTAASDNRPRAARASRRPARPRRADRRGVRCAEGEAPRLIRSSPDPTAHGRDPWDRRRASQTCCPCPRTRSNAVRPEARMPLETEVATTAPGPTSGASRPPAPRAR